jgi:hypothetical protein
MVAGVNIVSGTKKYCEILKNTRVVFRILQYIVVPLTIFTPATIV